MKVAPNSNFCQYPVQPNMGYTRAIWANSTPIREATSVLVAPVRVLVVDDFAPWRRSVRSMLKRYAELQVVGEAADGLAAIQRASRLSPDLILLDIGLPNLSGIQAAKQIRHVVPGTRIIFVTQNSDRDVVQAALGTGAKGYVLKPDSGSELRPAIEAVLQGKQFVSSGLTARLQVVTSRLS